MPTSPRNADVTDPNTFSRRHSIGTPEIIFMILSHSRAAASGATEQAEGNTRPLLPPRMRTRPQVRTQTRRDRDQDECFDTKYEDDTSGSSLKYNDCWKCGSPVSSSKERNKVFQLINCAVHPDTNRYGFYIICQDKEKPSLVARPSKRLTPAMAPRLCREKIVDVEKMAKNTYHRYRYFSNEHGFARYILAVAAQKKTTKINQISDDEQSFGDHLLIRLIVDENLPFAICDNREQGRPRLLKLILIFLRPGLKMSLGHRIRTDILDKYYMDTLNEVKTELRKSLSTSRATIMFDGATDVNGSPMVNLLVRLTGKVRVDTKTFFLTKDYTGCDTCAVDYYVGIRENVVHDSSLSSIFAPLVTDNTSCVQETRDLFMASLGRVISIQDQAHAADMRMEDLGDITWIRKTLSSLSNIGSVLRRLQKPRRKVVELYL